MWHQPQFAGGCWDGGSTSTAVGSGVDLGGSSSVLPSGSPYNHQPSTASVYGCPAFSDGAAPGSGAYVGGYDGSTPGPAPPYYGMYGLPSLAAASPWSTGHTPSLGYNAVRLLTRFHISPKNSADGAQLTF